MIAIKIEKEKLKEILIDYVTEEDSEEIIKRIEDEDEEYEEEETEDKRFNERGY